MISAIKLAPGQGRIRTIKRRELRLRHDQEDFIFKYLGEGVEIRQEQARIDNFVKRSQMNFKC